MATNLQMTYSNSFSFFLSALFRIKFHWSNKQWAIIRTGYKPLFEAIMA